MCGRQYREDVEVAGESGQSSPTPGDAGGSSSGGPKRNSVGVDGRYRRVAARADGRTGGIVPEWHKPWTGHELAARLDS